MTTAELAAELGYRPDGALVTGSVPLGSNRDVFERVSDALGPYLRRLPDGETGDRLRWTSWTAPSYERTRGLELVDPPEGSYTIRKMAKLMIPIEELELQPLGYGDAAAASWQVFDELQQAGTIPNHLRFQVSLPSPLAGMMTLVEAGSRAVIEPAHIELLMRELGQVLDTVPHDRLAIQWDVCQDVGVWEGQFEAYFDGPKQGVIDRLAQLAGAVPPEVEVGYHLCYGDFRHAHFMQPTDLGVCTEITNRLVGAAPRHVTWMHFPVPIDRDDVEFFAPLSQLELEPSSELYLGLIHFHDGVEGAARRIAAAHQVRDSFGAATECGWGRREPATIGQLMQLHAQICKPVI